MTQAGIHNPIPSAPDSGDPPRGAWVWPAVVVGLLSLQVVICTAAYFVATSDPSQVVVSDYHSKALAWDEHRAEQRAAEALGWQHELDIAREADMLGDRIVRLSLLDADGQALTDATVRVQAYHFARANQVVQADLKEVSPGMYVVQMNMRRPGRWAMTFDVTRGDDHCPITVQPQVGPTAWETP